MPYQGTFSLANLLAVFLFLGKLLEELLSELELLLDETDDDMLLLLISTCGGVWRRSLFSGKDSSTRMFLGDYMDLLAALQ